MHSKPSCKRYPHAIRIRNHPSLTPHGTAEVPMIKHVTSRHWNAAFISLSVSVRGHEMCSHAGARIAPAKLESLVRTNCGVCEAAGGGGGGRSTCMRAHICSFGRRRCCCSSPEWKRQQQADLLLLLHTPLFMNASHGSVLYPNGRAPCRTASSSLQSTAQDEIRAQQSAASYSLPLCPYTSTVQK